MMETDKYSRSKDMFDKLSYILSKNGDQVLFHSLKFFTQDCLDFQTNRCDDIPTIFELINEASEGKFSDHDKFAFIHKLLQVINNQMDQGYITQAMELIQPSAMETTSEEELSFLSRVSPKEPPPSRPIQRPLPSYSPQASSPTITDPYVFEIANNISAGNLEIFAVMGLGMSLTEYENATYDSRKHNAKAREVMKWWKQKGQTVKTPPYTKSGLKHALQVAKLNGVCRDLGLL